MPDKDDIKIHNISSSGGTGSKLVVNNRPLKADSTDQIDNSSETSDNLVTTHKNVIQPLERAETADGNNQVQESEAEPKTEADSEVTEPNQSVEAGAHSDDNGPADSIGDDSNGDDSDADDAESEEKSAESDKDKADAEAARAEQLATYEAMAASGKYYLPIKTSGERRWVTFLLILIVVLLAIIALDLLLDANILKINNFSPPTHFFN